MYGKYWIPFHPLFVGPLGFLSFLFSLVHSSSSLFIYAAYVTLCIFLSRRHSLPFIEFYLLKLYFVIVFASFFLVFRYTFLSKDELACTMYVDFRFHRGLFPRLGYLPIYTFLYGCGMYIGLVYG